MDVQYGKSTLSTCTGELDLVGLIIGELPDTVHKNAHYFVSRDMVLDCRGYLEIHKDAHFGRGVKIITAAHTAVGQLSWRQRGIRVSVVIEKDVFINAYAILYNTRIGQNSIVSAGSVVLGRNVAPNVIVAGNPARVIARWKETAKVDGGTHNHWEYVRKYFGELK